jgi:hypothetical protein
MDRLIHFLDSDLIPEIEGLEQSISRADVYASAMYRLFITDGFLWLHLGVEIGAFPKEAAQDCLDEYFRPFFRSLNSPDSGERSGSPTAYANHSDESWALITAFPHFAGILIEKAMRGDRDVLSSEQSLFGRPDNLVTMFQSLLLLRDHLRRNAVRGFVRTVNFVSGEEWQSTWRGTCSPEEVEKAEATDFAGSTKARIFAGYLILYRYGLQMKDLFDGFADDPLLDSTDLLKVRSRVREMLKWLVNLSSRLSSHRLGVVQTELIEALEEQAHTDSNVSLALVSAIQESMEESLDVIGLPLFVFAH